MKSNPIYKTLTGLLLVSLSLGTIGCGPLYDDLKEWQYIPEPSEEEGAGGGSANNKGDAPLDVIEGELKSGLRLMLDHDTHKYQYQRANSIDVFAGYFCVSHSAFEYGKPLLNTYDFPNGYYGGSMGESKKLYPFLYRAYHYAGNEKHNMPEWRALAQICFAYNMQELVDFYGPVPYDDFRELKEIPPLTYISDKEAYDRLFTDLEEAVAVLKQRQPSAEALRRIEGEVGGFSDLNWRNWVKFANSIRLRMALNIVKFDPARAQLIAETVVNDEVGVLQYGDKDFQQSIHNRPQHPLFTICGSWKDSRLGASLENIMKRYNNPLLGKWFDKNMGAVKSNGKVTLSGNSEYLGMRQGCNVAPTAESGAYLEFSVFRDQYMPRHYLKVSEVLFTRAEGALRGWNMGGTAQELYEQGVRKVFEENEMGGAFDEYVSQNKVEEIDYVDYHKPENSIAGRVTVGVAWNEEDSNEVKLEKIVTQKYIANFPMSAEAWTTFRRTGYPRLFPVQERNTWADGSFDVELQIRRIPYETAGTALDNANIANVEAALGQKNTAGVRLFWDVQTEERVDGNPKGIVIPKNF